MTFGFRLFTFAELCLTWSLNAAWAAGSCHIHPLGTDMKDAELRATEWYGSLEEFEIAIKKFHGGLGICHCFPDGIFNGRGDDWRPRLRDFSPPQDPPSE